jgi:hypothetical protein
MNTPFSCWEALCRTGLGSASAGFGKAYIGLYRAEAPPAAVKTGGTTASRQPLLVPGGE